MNQEEAQCVLTSAPRLWQLLLLGSMLFIALAAFIHGRHPDFGQTGDSLTLIAYAAAANGVLLAAWSAVVLWDQSRARKLMNGAGA